MILVSFVLLLNAMIVIPKMYYQRQWRDLFVFLTITIIGIALGILMQLKVELPYVGSMINRLVEKIIK